MSVVNVVRFKNAIEQAAKDLREAADALSDLAKDHDGPQGEASEMLAGLIDSLRAYAGWTDRVKEVTKKMLLSFAESPAR